jgi:hypothetical protein
VSVVLADIAQEKRDKVEDSGWAVSKAKQFSVRGKKYTHIVFFTPFLLLPYRN